MKEKKETLTLKELKQKNHACTDKVVSDLEYSFHRDFTDEMACHYAGINPDTYYRWRKESEEFTEKITASAQKLPEKIASLSRSA